MIDCFSDMFKLQKKFTEEFFEKTHNIDIKALFCDKEELGKHSREYILAAINKCSELVKDMNWKISADRISMNEDVDSNFKEHCIDVFKYILGLMIIHGMDEKQIYDEFIEKSIVVSEKFRQNNEFERMVKDNKSGVLKHPVILIDIDGVLSDYPKTFIKCFNKEYNTEYETLEELKEKHKNLIDYCDYKKIYRSSGIKRELEVIPNYEVLNVWKNLGIKIVLLTSRPYERYSRIYKDTIHWLYKNNICFDFIVWNENKAEYAINKIGKKNILFAVDDEKGNITSYEQHKIKCFSMRNDYLYNSRMKFVNLIESLDQIEIERNDKNEQGFDIKRI